MTAKCFDGMDIEKLPVEVVTDKAKRQEVFENIAKARETYPTLDPETSTGDFTWACYGEIEDIFPNAARYPGRYQKDQVVAMRFEDWGTNNLLSI